MGDFFTRCGLIAKHSNAVDHIFIDEATEDLVIEIKEITTTAPKTRTNFRHPAKLMKIVLATASVTAADS